LDAVRIREALNGAMGLARDANRYIDAQAPWTQVKEDRPAAARSLYTSLHAISALSVMLHPFLPFSTQSLHEALGGSGRVEEAGWVITKPVPGTPIPQPAPLFAKLDDSVVESMVGLLG
jgi:methionyl-tRNA synthetase